MTQGRWIKWLHRQYREKIAPGNDRSYLPTELLPDWMIAPGSNINFNFAGRRGHLRERYLSVHPRCNRIWYNVSLVWVYQQYHEKISEVPSAFTLLGTPQAPDHDSSSLPKEKYCLGGRLHLELELIFISNYLVGTNSCEWGGGHQCAHIASECDTGSV